MMHDGLSDSDQVLRQQVSMRQEQTESQNPAEAAALAL